MPAADTDYVAIEIRDTNKPMYQVWVSAEDSWAVFDYERETGKSFRFHFGTGYVRAGRVYLHRWICELADSDKRVVEHINGNHLDNRRSNLRVVEVSDAS